MQHISLVAMQDKISWFGFRSTVHLEVKGKFFNCQKYVTVKARYQLILDNLYVLN